MISTISSKNISFIFQGKITAHLKKSLTNIRNLFPNCEIILSTWENESIGKEIEEFSDIILLNSDPGGVVCNYVNSVTNNQNRQVLSTLNGIKSASRPYVCKMRTDFELKNSDFLSFWNSFPKRKKEWSIFNHKVIVCSAFCRYFSSETYRPMPFHISDFFLFGLKEDVLALFESTGFNRTKNELGNWEYLHPDRVPYINVHWRYPPEQFIFFSLVKQYFPEIKFYDWSDFNSDNIKQSEELIISNFIILDYDQIELFSHKHIRGLIAAKHSMPGIITHKYFKYLYSKHFAYKYSPNPIFILGRTFDSPLDIDKRILLHKQKVTQPFLQLLQYVKSCLALFIFSFARILIKRKR